MRFRSVNVENLCPFAQKRATAVRRKRPRNEFGLNKTREPEKHPKPSPARSTAKKREGVKKNTFSLIIAYVFFANQKEKAVFLRRPDLWNLLFIPENGYWYGIGFLTRAVHQLFPKLTKFLNGRIKSYTSMSPFLGSESNRFCDLTGHILKFIR